MTATIILCLSPLFCVLFFGELVIFLRGFLPFGAKNDPQNTCGAVSTLPDDKHTWKTDDFFASAD
jgi:hypothetical protein